MANKKLSGKKAPDISPIEIPIKIQLFLEISSGPDKKVTLRAAPPQGPEASIQGLEAFTREAVDLTSIEVNSLILAVIHNRSIKPRDLSPDFNLEDDLGYDDDTRDFLHIALNNYVDHKSHGQGISQTEMDNCATVGDCIDVVKSKL